MLIYPAHALAPSFGQSAEPVGLLDLSRLEVIYANDAFASWIERVQINHSKHWVRDWPELQQAIQSCAQQDALHGCEHGVWGMRVELLAVQLQHADGTSQRVVQCKPIALTDVDTHTANLLDWSPHSSWACTLNGEVFWTNRASNLMTYGQEVTHDLSNTRYIEKIHPEDLQPISEHFGAAMVEGRCTPSRYRLRDHTGRFRWYLFTAAPVLAEDGSMRLWVGSSVDIHELVETEDRLQADVARLESQLRAAQVMHASAQKVELLAQLAGGVTHDLNNLLFVMRMHMGSLQSKLLDPAMLASLQVMGDCIRNATRLSSQLSGFSGRLPQNAVPLNVAQVIHEAQPLFAKAVGAEVDFSIHIDPAVSAVLADRSYLENALINLMINARDALNGRGTVQLHVHPDSSAQSSWGADTSTPFIAFKVQDDGAGMNEQLQASIFTPFFTTKGPGQGTGLGLPMVKNFVESSGGHMLLQTAPSQGTTIGFVLPVTTQAVETLSPEKHQPVRAAGHASVLLVEDDEAVRQAISMRLLELDYAIISVPNPDTAIRYLENGLLPDVILSDIRMPGKKTVLDMITYVETHLPTPMIFITGYSADVVIREGLMADRHPVLFKPFSIDDLVLKMQEVITSKPALESSGSL